MLNICPDIFDSLWYMNIKSGGWEGGEKLTFNNEWFLFYNSKKTKFGI